MKLPSKLYDVLKWIFLIVSPALCALLTTLNTLWGWNLPIEAIVGSINGVSAFFGIILGISSSNYSKAQQKAKEVIK